MLLLSASLPHLEFRPGRAFSVGETAATAGLDVVPESGSEILLLFLRGVVMVALVLLPISIVLSLRNRQGRVRLLVNVVSLLVLLLALNRLTLNRVEPLALEVELGLLEEPPFESASSGLGDQFLGRVPSWLEAVGVVALAALASGAAVGLFRWFIKAREPVCSSPVSGLAQSAQHALDALHAGDSVRDAVIRSYVEMSRVLHEERDIQRGRAMTPREFEELLEHLGFPPAPVQELTRLFERARYGSQLSGEREEQRAVASLRAILTHCRASGVRQ
jgi:hypothetical protein